jgi:hypothetical protein
MVGAMTDHAAGWLGADSWPGAGSLRRAMADAESRMGAAMEQLVAGKGFADLLGQAAENAVSLTTINAQVWDLVLRNLRMAGRGDVHRLGGRLNGIDDKLEAVLQEIEDLGASRMPSGEPA